MAYLLTRNRDRSFCGKVQLQSALATIGRSSRAAIRIQDRSVSKIHASIEPIPGTTQYRIRDLGSRNGIYFRGERCAEADLAPGDEARLGAVFLTLCADAAFGEAAQEVSLLHEGIESSEFTSGPAAGDAGRANRAEGRYRERLITGGERGLLAVFLVLGAVLGGTVWMLPPGTLTGRRGDEVQNSISAPLAALPPAAAPKNSTTLESNSSGSHALETAKKPPAHNWQDDHRALWGGLGRALDSSCAEVGCHASAAVVDFHKSSGAPYGRWERNLLAVRGRAAIAGVGIGAANYSLGAFSDSAPHDKELSLAFGADFEQAVEWLSRAPGRLLGSDLPPPRYEEIAQAAPEALSRVRRAWLILHGRLPSLAELLSALESTPRDWVLSARSESDARFHAWYFEALNDPPQPLTPEQFLRSVWCVLWNRPPAEWEDACLKEVLASGFDWTELREPLTRFLVRAPRVPLQPHDTEDAANWIAGLGKWLLGRELVHEAPDAIADRIRAGTLDYRLFIEECLLSMNSSAAANAQSSDPPAEAGVRVEVVCDSPVRDIIRRPDGIPYLWARFEQSIVQTFRDDPAPLAQLTGAALAGALATERIIVCNPSSIPAECDTSHVLLADGMLFPALRRLADDAGDPLSFAGSDGDRAWLRAQLSVSAPTSGGGANSCFLIVQHGPRIVGAGTAALVGERPAARTLRLASALLAAHPNEPLSVWVSLPAASQETSMGATWEDFTTALELVALTHPAVAFDVWFWGRSAADETETVRVMWGPGISRGVVERQAQPARDLHPHLRQGGVSRPPADAPAESAPPGAAGKEER